MSWSIKFYNAAISSDVKRTTAQQLGAPLWVIMALLGAEHSQLQGGARSGVMSTWLERNGHQDPGGTQGWKT